MVDNRRFDKFSAEDWKDFCGWNPDYIPHKENWTLRDELRPAFFLRTYFIEQQKLLLGLQTAENLCNGKEESYQINGFDMETGLPKTGTIYREDVARILKPFRHEQRVVYDFLSSGKTDGILLKIQEDLAKQLPLHCRVDLENLIALARPGQLFYWDAYKEKRHCLLTMASEIARPTRGVLLYGEQQMLALQLLTGCSQEEAIILYEKECGTKIHRPYRELLLQLIAEHNGITREEAKMLHEDWHFYTLYGGVRHYKIVKIAHQIYLRALEYLHDKEKIRIDSSI